MGRPAEPLGALRPSDRSDSGSSGRPSPFSWFRPLEQSGQHGQQGGGSGPALDLPGVGEGPCDENLRGDAPMAEHLR
jgi:hypothetical protein